MKRNKLFILGLIFFILNINFLYSQCSNFYSNYPAGTFSSPGPTLTTVSTVVWGGEYSYYSVTAGCTYTWSTCLSSYDTQLTLWNQTGTVSYAYSDDACGLQSEITWTATFTGIVVVLVSEYNCYTGSTNTILQWSETCPSCGPNGLIVDPSAIMICGGGSETVTFSASGTCTGSYQYRVLNGATVVQNWSTSSTFTASPGATTTYTVEVRCSTCPTTIVSQTFVVEVIDQPVITGNLQICAGDNTVVTASGSTGDFEWWTAQTGGTQLAVGPTYTTPNLTSNTTYWVQANGTSSSGAGVVLITECGLYGFPGASDADYIEISNLYSTPVNTTGWVCAVSNSYSTLNSVNPTYWYLPSSFTPCSMIKRSDVSSLPDYWGQNILWDPNQNGWAIIIDDVGNIVDFCAWGWTAAELASFNNVINGFTITLGAEWTGNGCSSACSPVSGVPYSLSRIGNSDSNTSADFICQESTQDVLNPGLNCGWVAVSCRFPVDITVNDVSFTTSSTDPSCNGGSNGVASVISPTGGTTPYSYDWSPNGYTGDGTPNYTNLPAGTYTVTVQDAVGCTETASIVLSNPSPMNLTMSSTPDNCGDCDGTASVSVSGGTPSYSYSWSGGGGTGSSASGLCTGNYTVTVTDNNGCTSTNNINVGTTGTVTASFTYNGNQCLNGNNYVFTNTGTTGGGATFLWNFGDGNTSTSENPTHTYAAAGTYTVILEVTSGSCSDIYTQTVTVYEEPTVSIIPSDATCATFCDGSATANPSGGSGTYNYSWSNSQTGQTATGLCFGTYDLTVTDTYGCSVTNSVTINEPAALLITITRTDASCNGVCDGTANATVTGGSGVYTYLWDNLQTTANLTGLCAGTFTLTVTDALSTPGCYQTASVVIDEPVAITLSTSSVDASCGGSDGTATVTVTGGGTPGYTYQWDTNALNQTTATATGLSSGSYSVTVSDANGCTSITTVSVNTSAGPTATITSSTDPSCNGVCDGTATVTPSGGTPGYTYSWSGSGSTTANATGLCDGIVSVTVTDALGCSATDNITLTEPSAVSAVISSTTDANCGQSNGSATVSAAGGTPGYSYLWPSGAGSQTTATASNLAMGNYIVTVSDANGCTVTATAVISDIAGVVASIDATTDASCNGVCDGTATVSGTGGTLGYTYLWDAGASWQSTSTATGLCVGSYDVTVTDSDGCTSVATATINEPLLLTASITASTDASCNGVCDGTATVSGSGGTPGYTYSWSNGLTTVTATGLCTGVYTATVTDINGCTSTSNVTINHPNAVATLASAIDAHCGLPDGSATVTGSGGTPGYTYQWDASTGNQTTQTATNLAPNTYLVTVTDANGCTGTASATVGDQPGITSVISSFVDPLCNGSCDGSITVSVSGGTAPYDYLWSDNQLNATAVNLCAGSFDVTITDANGCTGTANQTLIEPIALTVIAASTDITCFGACDGQFTANVSGGTSGYTYQWDDTGFSMTQTIMNLCADTYCVTVTDANGCTTEDCGTISDPPQMNLSVVITDASCGQADGAIDLTVAGATPVSYFWSPVGATTQDIDSITAGTYSVTVIDVRGCKEYGTYTVIDASGPTISITGTTNVSCFGICDGTASVTGTGGVAPYTFIWSDGQNGMTATNLCVGAYNVTITDQNGCSASVNTNITQPNNLVISNIVSTNPLCNGDCDGTAAVIPVGGTIPYNYQWTGGTPVGGNNPTDSLTTGLCSGVFTIIITDANGCTVTDNVTISEPPFISLSTSSVDATCSGFADGSATVFPTGGTGTYTYQWDTNAANQSTQTANNLTDGTYWVTVTDGNGCTESISVVVNTPNPMSFTNITSNDLTCHSSADGDISISVAGGTPNYLYNWTNWNGTYSSGSQNISNLSQDTYFLTVTDQNGCSITTSVIINQPPALNLILNANDETCYQLCDGSINVIVSGGTPTSYSYMWSNLQTTSTAGNLCPGVYWVTVTDGNGCTITGNETVSGNPELLLVIDNIVDATCGQSNGEAYLSNIGGTTGYTYLWSNGWNSLDQTGLAAGNYTVSCIDNNGCVTDTLITINNLGGPTITSVTGTDVTCYGDGNGSALVTYNPSSPAAPPYIINWSNGGSSTIETNLGGGTYYVTVTDANGCSSSGSVVIDEPPQVISAIINSTNASCYGVCDGSAIVQAGGGVGGYTYTWSNGQTGITNATGLCAGVTSVNVSDANGCQSISYVTVTEPSDFTVSGTISNVSCYGTCDGIISVNASGGTGILNYNWLPPASGGSSVVAGLCGDQIYTVIVSDQNGCDTILDYYVSEPEAINIYTSSTPTTCGLINGVAQIDSITGGTGNWQTNWTYNWSPGNYNTYQISNVDNGSYALQVWDQNGCSENVNVYIGDTPPPEAINITVTDILCPGNGNGEIAVTNVTGGTSPYTYQWSSGHTSSTATSLIAGMYFVTVTDADGCTISGFGTVAEPSPLNVIVNGPVEPICIGQFAQISATGSGGTPPYDYVWSDSTITDSSQVQTVYPATTTSYQVNVVDANGCISSPPATVVVQVHPPLTVYVDPDSTICEGESIDIEAYPGGGNGGPYTVQWSNAPAGNPTTVSPMTNTTYIVTVYDGCGTPSITDSLTINLSVAPDVSNFSVGNGCAPVQIQFRPDSVNSGWTYNWNFDDMSSGANNNSTDSEPWHTFANSGLYSVQLVVTNSNNCKTTLHGDVNAYEVPEASFYITPEVVDVLNANVEFYDQSTPGVVNWEWNFGDGNSSQGPYSNVEHEYDLVGSHEIQLVVHTGYECTDTAYGMIEVKEAHTFYAPTAFSPGSGLQNSYFYPRGIGIDPEEYHLYIFDRWGEVIFETDEYPLATDDVSDRGLTEGGWNGKYNNTGKYVPVGTYTWLVLCRDVNGTMHEYVGAVTVIR